MWKVPFGVELNNAGESGRLRTSLKSFWCHPFSPCLVYKYLEDGETLFELPSPSLTQTLKSYLPNRKAVFQPPFVGGHVKLRGCTFMLPDWC